jgi:hypothetical protein
MSDKDKASTSVTLHSCPTSVGVAISIPKTNMTFCIDNVSYSDGEIKVEYVLKATTERKKKRSKKSKMEEFVMIKGYQTFDISRFTKETNGTEQTNE